MNDHRVERLADILVGYSVGVESGDLVSIRGDHVAEPLILAIYRRCLDAGAHPMIRATLPHAPYYLYKHASDEQLDFVWETERWFVDNLDCSFSIISDTNTRQMSRIDPARPAIAARARKELSNRWYERAARGEARWNVTLFPTEAHAMDAEMSLPEYEDFFYAACLVDADDPVAEWRKVADRHARLIEWIKDKNEIHIEGEGTDLVLGIGGRKWMPADGKENFPDGEIFTAPVETATRGHVSFTYPAIYNGVSVEGIRLEFEGGSIVDARADKNENFLIKTLDIDDGARVLGELGIGTNYGIEAFTGEILLDEKIGGTIHLAIGMPYPECGGTNESAVHWDMVCDLRKGGRITVDGEALMEDGRLLI